MSRYSTADGTLLAVLALVLTLSSQQALLKLAPPVSEVMLLSRTRLGLLRFHTTKLRNPLPFLKIFAAAFARTRFLIGWGERAIASFSLIKCHLLIHYEHLYRHPACELLNRLGTSDWPTVEAISRSGQPIFNT